MKFKAQLELGRPVFLSTGGRFTKQYWTLIAWRFTSLKTRDFVALVPTYKKVALHIKIKEEPFRQGLRFRTKSQPTKRRKIWSLRSQLNENNNSSPN